MTTQALSGAYRGFLETYEPLRPELYRYCRYLTRTPWDAEDLAQDTLARAFVTLAQMHGGEPPNPRRGCSASRSTCGSIELRRRRDVPASRTRCRHGPNRRRDARSGRHAAREAVAAGARGGGAQGRLRAVARGDCRGARRRRSARVKAALHRGRGKLVDDSVPTAETAPVPAALDAFCRGVQRRRSRCG